MTDGLHCGPLGGQEKGVGGAEEQERSPRDNEVSCVTDTVDLPSVQTLQNVEGNLLGADVAIRSRS